VAEGENPKLKYHIQRLGTLRTERSSFNAQWEEAAALLMPAHVGQFVSYGATVALGQQGQKNTDLQYDATAALAAMRFMAVMESLATPRNQRWGYITTADKTLKRNRRVREFFDQVNDRLFSYRYRPIANFTGNMQQTYHSSGIYGNGSIFVDAPDKSKGLRYRNAFLGETYFVTDHAGIVDTMYRPFWRTARQAVQEFPNVPEAIRLAASSATESERKFQFLHVVTPRDDFTPGLLGDQGKLYSSFYMALEPQAMLSEGGYNSFPWAVTRYTQASGEDYGRGPAQWVLPAIKLLNEEKHTVIKQGHRITDPVLLIHDNGVLDGFSMRAGAKNIGGMTADGKPLVGVLPAGNIAIGEKMMEMERSVINDAFLVSLFQILVENPQMTATEVLERTREKGMLLAPTAGRFQDEFLGPLIARELEVLFMQGLLPEPPPILVQSGSEYTIEYDSPMSRIQKAEGASGFTRTLQMAAEYANMTQDPSPLDHFNFDAAMPDLLDQSGAPVAWTRSAEDVAARRKERSDAAQAQQVIQAAPGAAALLKAMPGAAKGGRGA